MIKLNFRDDLNRPLNILCLGAHSDDIEVGCGGTLRKLALEYPAIQFTWVVFSAQEQRKAEALASARDILKEHMHSRVIIQSFRDGFFPYFGVEIKEFFEQLKQEETPDIIFTHYRQDLHQDHRLISELSWNTFRDHLILEYEIPKYDGDLGAPNFYVHLDEKTCQQKVISLLENFQSQKNKHWFAGDTFFALLRIRGIESRSPSCYAEAFYCRKVILQTCL
jgi:LmbE family N-acetylglucosaminyl deacetylase